MFTLFMMSGASLLTAFVMYGAMIEDPDEPTVVVGIFIVWALGLVVSTTSLITQEYMSLSAAPVKSAAPGPAEMSPSEAKALLKPENSHPKESYVH